MIRKILTALTGRDPRLWEADRKASVTERVSEGNILVVMTGGIGDAVMGIPFLSLLKEAAPRVKISVLAGSLNKEILQGRAEISDFVMFPFTRSRDIVSLASLIGSLRQIRLAAIVGLLPSNLKSHSLIARFAGSGRSIKHLHHYPEESGDWQFWFTDLVKDDEGRHRVLANVELLRPLGIDISDISQADVQRRMRIVLTSEERNRAKDLHAKPSTGAARIGFHPGCKPGWEFKQWDRRNYAELADQIIREHGAEVIWFGGKDEIGIVESIMANMRNDSTTMAGKLPLRDTASLIGTCDLFVSNDSGLMHVATAVDVPTIGLFSSVNPRNNPVRTGPFGFQHRVVKALDLQHISIQDVHAEVVNCLMNRNKRT